MNMFGKIIRQRKWKVLSVAFVAVFAGAGYFFPVLGLVVLALMIVALGMNFNKRRSFCAGTCPNGTFLASALKPVSRNRKMPRALVSVQFRRMLCGVMMFCMIGLLVRGYPNLANIGRVFWVIYSIALSLGVLAGLFYKPRAWCAFCPLGTLQDTIAGVSKEADK
ncbi:MAG: 4Fe-4S binding protein [Treponemataceae bacterium]